MTERPLQPQDRDMHYSPGDDDNWDDWLRADPCWHEWLDNLNDKFQEEFGENHAPRE